MTSDARSGRARRRELRRARKLAAERQRAWDEIRAAQQPDRTRAGDHRAAAPVTHVAPVDGVARPRPALFPAQTTAQATTRTAGEQADRPDGGSRSRLRAVAGVLQPLLGAIFLTVAVVGGTPLVSGTWNLAWGATSLTIAAVLLATCPRTWRQTARGIRVAGSGAALLVAVGAATGMVAQNVVEGRAQLRGSVVDVAVEERDELERSLSVLVENHGLLALPPEQAIPLRDRLVYQRAIEQSRAIADRWNPATAGDPVLPVLGDAYVLLNRAATGQTEALTGFVENLGNPEPAKARAVVERANAVAATLTTDVPATLSALEQAIRDRAREEQR